MRKSRFLRTGMGIIASGLVMGLLSGCGSKSGVLSTPVGGEVSRSYRYTLQINAFLAPPATTPVRIEVQEGKAVSVTPIDRSVTIDPAFFAKYDTITKLQTIIDDAKKNNADQVDVTYDSKTGIPTSAFIDYSRAMADEEFGFTITDYVPL